MMDDLNAKVNSNNIFDCLFFLVCGFLQVPRAQGRKGIIQGAT